MQTPKQLKVNKSEALRDLTDLFVIKQIKRHIKDYWQGNKGVYVQVSLSEDTILFCHPNIPRGNVRGADCIGETVSDGLLFSYQILMDDIREYFRFYGWDVKLTDEGVSTLSSKSGNNKSSFYVAVFFVSPLEIVSETVSYKEMIKEAKKLYDFASASGYKGVNIPLEVCFYLDIGRKEYDDIVSEMGENEK